MKYDVHVYFTMRVKLKGIEAGSQREAIKRARHLFAGLPDMLASRGGLIHEFGDGEEVTGYLVDEQGDENYSVSRFYTAGGNPIRNRQYAKIRKQGVS